MPPPDSNKSLTDEERNLIRRWIEEGARYEMHWAFETPVLSPAPAVENEAWVRNSIDRFQQSRIDLHQEFAKAVEFGWRAGVPHPVPDGNRSIVQPLDEIHIAADSAEQSADDRRTHGGQRMTSSLRLWWAFDAAAHVDQGLATNTSASSPRRRMTCMSLLKWDGNVHTLTTILRKPVKGYLGLVRQPRRLQSPNEQPSSPLNYVVNCLDR